ncbi:3-dehydroquinate synthase [Staphylococcus felis]|uniref:3-dehydroquinate synthase n=1 Tax=Staphylococcus felis TaxID=46127 RepID=UPI000CD1C334|nr:3-dehydroquinate synthase [Staphylococcus felis]AVP37076.1 3-dehydroquinate synthase [Staphylococcus felis]PNZ35635.1 3-dehydroquinate synthase [Staphylococcus felis]QQB02972.1 3-dehydroquinate synthase [Staphylococcus felis]REH75922.1 3-dehydroquinate synthase [Staphylococcus felis]REH79024.1 3-dehydroquinate synthase [Staphylococcus felis]
MQFVTTYPNRNYPIIIEKNASTKLNAFLEHYQHVFILADEEVYHYWKTKIDHIVQSTQSHLILLTSGEKLKNIQHYSTVMEKLLSFQPTRQTCLVSIGGGATGDFVGFLASTLLRGVDLIQMPTTILAHDSSIGGKVGINASQGKNLIGAFHRPSAVLYDLEFLNTLPKSEILSGYAELYKHALLKGEKATLDIERHYNSLNSLLSLSHIESFIFQGIQTKLEIVLKDELEKGQRQYLNLGHTFGHAIEYQHKLPHGHAVMIGILYQFIVTNLIHDTQFDIHHYYQYCVSMSYPVEYIHQFSFEPLYTLMLQDKKNNSDGIRMVLLTELGSPTVCTVNQAILKQAFQILKSLGEEAS